MTAPDLVLDRRRLYMLPTRSGWLFAAALVTMLLAAVNYNNSLAYMLTFLLGSVALVSMLYTHYNLSGLRIDAGPGRPAFAGEPASFPVWLHNEGPKPRLDLRIVQDRREVARLDLPPGGSACVELAARSARRGLLDAPPFVLTSAFPLGLLFTWSRAIRLGQQALIYPRPGPPRPLAPAPDRRRYQELGEQSEGDDFAGLREYRRGDSPRHLHWRTLARGQGLYTKLFAGAGQDTVWLDWEALPGLATEPRLSALCRWAVDAEREGRRYGLRLPGRTLAPDRGEVHRHACLSALALFRLPAKDPATAAAAGRWFRGRRPRAAGGG